MRFLRQLRPHIVKINARCAIFFSENVFLHILPRSAKLALTKYDLTLNFLQYNTFS